MIYLIDVLTIFQNNILFCCWVFVWYVYILTHVEITPVEIVQRHSNENMYFPVFIFNVMSTSCVDGVISQGQRPIYEFFMFTERLNLLSCYKYQMYWIKFVVSHFQSLWIKLNLTKYIIHSLFEQYVIFNLPLFVDDINYVKFDSGPKWQSGDTIII